MSSTAKLVQDELLIREKPVKALFVFSLPIILGQLFMEFYSMMDSVVVGRYVSAEALAAVGATHSLTNFFIWFAFGGAIGASVVQGRYYGAEEYGKMKTATYTALITLVTLSAVLGVFGFFCGRGIMAFLRTPADVIGLAASYLRIYFLGLPFMFMYDVLANMFNALGKSRIPLYFLIFSSLLNIGLDVLMVRGFHLGVAGAALATVIAQGVSATLSAVVLFRYMNRLSDEKVPLFSGKECLAMTKIAIPSILQQSTVSIGMMAVQSVANSFGAQMLAGYSAASRIDAICIVPGASLSNALTNYTAMNLGAKRTDRVKQGLRAATVIVAGYSAVIFVVLRLFRVPIIRMFLGENLTRTSLQTGVAFLGFTCFFYFLIGFKFQVDGLLRGAGDMGWSTFANMANLGARVALSFLFAGLIGIPIVWMALPVGWGLNGLISFLHYRKGTWIHKKVGTV